MGANTTLYGDISPRTAAYAAVKLLERGQALLVTERFGQAKPIPKKHSKTITFRRYESWSPAVAPLGEGVPPEGQKLTKTDVSATLEQYGDKCELTDVIQDTHEDNVLQEMIDLASEQAAETIELVRISILNGGTRVELANNAATRATIASTVSRGDLRRITRYFHRHKAKTISSIVKASAMVSTEPVAPAFFAMGHTDLESDFANLEGWVKVANYSNSDKALPGEIGKIDNVRVILSPLFEPIEGGASSVSSTTFLAGGAIPSAAAAPDVYPILVIAKDAYGIVPLQGKNAIKPMVVNPGKPSVGNECGQIGFVSWITYQTACILNQHWMCRYEVLCTAKPS